MRDYYKVLGIQRTISQKDLKKHYYKLAKKYHPDAVSKENKKTSEKIFKEISVAYNALSTKEKRRRYDMGGMQGNFVYAGGFTSTPNKPKKDMILSKLNGKVNFSIQSFAGELRVSYSNLEKIIKKFFEILDINARIAQGNVIFVKTT